jgi:predicted permease
LLLVGQVALTVVLLVGAGLFVRSFRELQATELGFDYERLVLMDVGLPLARYGEIPDQISFYERLQERVRTLPGVAAVAGSSQPPGGASQMTFSFAIEGRVASNPTGREDDETLHAVLPGYFETIGARMASGRSFTAADRRDAPPVVILNETLASKHFPEGDAIGHRISFRPGETPWLEIVGVVADARLESPDLPPREAIFIPFAQKTWPWLTSMTIAVRPAGASDDPLPLAQALRSALLEIDPQVPPHTIHTVVEAFRANTSRRTFAMTLVGGFGALALLLSIVGLYGLVSYSVARERREIGVRLALGAHAGDMVARVLARSLLLAGAGAAVGLAGAAATSRTVASLLYGVSPTDVTTYALTAGIVVAVALATAVAPALRAARTDPIVAMRAD